MSEILDRIKAACNFSGRKANALRVAACLREHLRLCGYEGELRVVRLRKWSSVKRAWNKARAARAARAAGAAWAAWAAEAAEAAWAARAAGAAGDCSWRACYVAGAMELKDEKQIALWTPILEALEAGCWLYFVGKEVVWWVECPVIHHINGVPHCADGPAFVSLDRCDYFVNGKTLEAILNPEMEAAT